MAEGRRLDAEGPGTSLRIRVHVPLGSRRIQADMATDAEAVAIVGPSGAGKSTLLRVLAGVERHATGRIELGDRVWLDSDRGVFVPPWERRVGWVPQDALLFPHLTVRENLAYSRVPTTRVKEMADQLGLGELLDRRPRRLSGGERQRVALGRALLARPAVLLLDEPFAALDRELRTEVASRVRSLAVRMRSRIVLVSHDEEDTSILAHERWMLTEGALRRVD